ncbi:MAG: hypothetical protein KBS81_01115 [Spirochaetales bacterium]|nr:hypothetical protein [Candidatus Physcosoma equi]
MKEWFKKKRNIAFLVALAASVVMVTIGGIRLYALLGKGFSVFSVKASIIKLVIDVVLVIAGLLVTLIAYKIKWMYETRVLLERQHQEFEELKALLEEKGQH